MRRNSWSLAYNCPVCLKWADGRVEKCVSDVSHSPSCPADPLSSFPFLSASAARLLFFFWHPSVCRAVITFFQLWELGNTRIRPHTHTHTPHSSSLLYRHSKVKESAKSLVYRHIPANTHPKKKKIYHLRLMGDTSRGSRYEWLLHTLVPTDKDRRQ